MVAIIILLFITISAFIIYITFFIRRLQAYKQSQTEILRSTPIDPATVNITTQSYTGINTPFPRVFNDAPSPRVVTSSSNNKESKAKRLRYFCINDKGYHVTVWPKVQGFQGIDYVDFTIAGITHGEHISDHLGEFVARLEADPLNPYDPNAIEILTREGHRVGYVPRDQTQQIRDFASLPCKCYCYIGENNGTYYSCCYISNPS